MQAGKREVRGTAKVGRREGDRKKERILPGPTDQGRGYHADALGEKPMQRAIKTSIQATSPEARKIGQTWVWTWILAQLISGMLVSISINER